MNYKGELDVISMGFSILQSRSEEALREDRKIEVWKHYESSIVLLIQNVMDKGKEQPLDTYLHPVYMKT